MTWFSCIVFIYGGRKQGICGGRGASEWDVWWDGAHFYAPNFKEVWACLCVHLFCTGSRMVRERILKFYMKNKHEK